MEHEIQPPTPTTIIADEQYLRAECIRVASTLKHGNLTDLLSDAEKLLKWVNNDK
jgi:hypothetical protein